MVLQNVREGKPIKKVNECAHDRIRHETSSFSYCKDCHVRMVRFRGDWMPHKSGG